MPDVASMTRWTHTPPSQWEGKKGLIVELVEIGVYDLFTISIHSC